MKKTLIMIVLLFTLGSVYAQNNTKAKPAKGKSEKKKPTPEEKAEKITNRLKTELSLTADQIPKVKEITLERVQAKAAAKTKAGEDKQAFKTERKAIFQKWETSLLSILTPEQQKTYFAKKEEKKKKSKEKKAKSKNTKVTDEAQEEQDDLEDEAGE